jgi:predicted TIM-barrel fold metal-dependent hydrolase
MGGRWRRDELEQLPILLDPASSDEYRPLPLSPVVREARRRAWAQAADNARRVGLSRRDFLRTSMGAATVLLTLNACSKEEAASRGTRPGGTFDVPEEAGVDQEAADSVLDGDLPVIDVQAHFLDFDLSEPLPPDFFGSDFPQAGCGAEDPRACFGIDRFVDTLYSRSETAAAVLSAIPAPDARAGELGLEVMQRARERINRSVGPGLLLIHGLVVPTGKPLSAALDDLEAIAETYKVDGWKAYTTNTQGWRLDDGDIEGRQVGMASLQKIVDLGIPRISIHKGISGGDKWASPDDVGPAAKAFPDVKFAIYHSGWEPGVTEEAYSAATAGQGSSRLVASLRKAGISPGQNVYAELGTTWFNLMRSPDEAAHLLGKLLVSVGEDRILWGTDSIWYGSPQGQIDAFRTFDISPEFQERFGYPALTDKVKGKIFARNAAEYYGLDLARIEKRPRPPGSPDTPSGPTTTPSRGSGSSDPSTVEHPSTTRHTTTTTETDPSTTTTTTTEPD